MQQQLIVTISDEPETESDDGASKINVQMSFDPGLTGPDSEEWHDMTDQEQELQQTVAYIAHTVMEVLGEGDAGDDESVH